MSWTYVQKTGQILHNDIEEGHGYSGYGIGKNAPIMQSVKGIGPLPCGFYVMGQPIDHPHLGPFAIPLIPDPTNEMFGRDDFFVHGDSKITPGKASHGCICTNPMLRKQMYSSNDLLLRVVKELAV